MAAPTFEFHPFTPTPERADIVQKILRGLMSLETLFTDYERACQPICDDIHSCPKCSSCLALVSWSMARRDSIFWEVWRTEPELDVVGILYVTGVIPGTDAVAHYAFFDNNLRNKTDLLRSWMEYLYSDHEGWTGLNRITVETPDYAFALAWHAHKHMGFGGQFSYKHNSKTIPVEGVKRGHVTWRGQRRDLLILGRLRDE